MSYFIPRGNRYYMSVASLPRFMRYVLSFIIFLLGIAIWYFFLYQDTKQQKKEWCANINQKKQLITMSKQIHQMIDKATFESEQLHNDYASYALSNHVSDIFFMINQNAKEAGLTIQSYIKSESQKHDWYQLTTISLQLKGEFNKITKYLEKMNQQSVFICTHLNLNFNDNAECVLDCQLQSINI